MRSNSILFFSLILCAGLFSGGSAFSQSAELAQNDDNDGEEEGSGFGWRPSGGSLFGETQNQDFQSSDDDLLERPSINAPEEDEDPRAPFLVFELEYEPGITFQETYQQRLEDTLWEELNNGVLNRPYTTTERGRQFREHVQIVGSTVPDDRAMRVAENIDVAFFVIPRIEIEDSRTYRIALTVGRTEHGSFEVLTRTSNRRVDNVVRALERTAEEALGLISGGE
jgi:hypothetical protein